MPTKDTAKDPASTSMEELLKTSPKFVSPRAGKMTDGIVFAIQKDKILVDIEGIATGIISGREMRDRSETMKSIKEGDEIQAYVIEEENAEGLVVLSLRRASQEKTWDEFQKAFEEGTIIEARPHEANKGGLLLEIDGIKGFIPVSQLAPLHYPRVNGANAQKILERLQKLIGITFSVKIINIDKENGKLILSEKAAMSEQRSAALHKLKVGQKVKGKISGIVKFGIFVAFGGIEGLVHISEIAWGHVNDPSDYGKLGNEIEVLVIGIEGEKISLSMKRLIADPWIEAAKTFKIGKVIESEITRVTEFGAFVKLNNEINGLIHLSEMSDDPNMKSAHEIVKAGDKVKAKIIAVDLDEHRIGLSLNTRASASPDKSKETDAPTQSKPEKTAKSPLPQKARAVGEMDGISKKIADILESAGYKTTEDLRNASKETLVALEGIGEKTAEKILASIETIE